MSRAESVPKGWSCGELAFANQYLVGPTPGQAPGHGTIPRRPRNSPLSRRSPCCPASSSCASAWSRSGGTTASTTRTIISCPAGDRSGTTATPTARPTMADDDARALQPLHRGRRHGRPAGRRASQPDGRRAHPQGDHPPARARRQRAQPVKDGDPRRGGRGQPGDPGQLRRGHRIHQHGDDRGAGPVPQRPGLRGRHRRLPRLPPPRGPARAADQGPLAGRRPARGRHDLRRGAADPQVQERAVPLPRQQGRPGRPGGCPRPRRPAGRSAAHGQRRAHRRRPRRGPPPGPGHDRRPPAGRRDPQGHGAGERLQG